MRQIWLSIIALIFATSPLFAASSDFDIRSRHESPREVAAAEQLRRLLDTYDVSPFVATYSVLIDETAAPHSHPVLTLNSYFLDDDAGALSTFIHEQMHWFELFMGPQVEAAIEDLKKIYPDMPNRGRGGGRDARGTYIHLLVGSQELQATASLMGMEEARRVIAGKTWYRWVYAQVLEREADLLAILEKHGLNFANQGGQ